MAKKQVYAFGGGKADGHGAMKDRLGGKGAGLAEMTRAGVPVPPGFTITTDVCLDFVETGSISEDVLGQIDKALAVLERRMKKKLGDPRDPLLVSVRSGARISMPGMMDTILNLGLNDRSVEGLADATGNRRFAYDSYRRFIQMFGDVVLGVPHADFEKVLTATRKEAGVKVDSELSAEHLETLVERYKQVVKRDTGRDFPQDPRDQLAEAIEAVFGSWDNERARRYRQIHEIPNDLGTACNVQAMVFGNKGDTSATGVGFTRDPATGEKVFYGEYLQNAQGEDVVAGIRTPRPLRDLAEVMPDAYGELREITARLEEHYRDVQDFEFTIEESALYMLQTRTGKRTGLAAVRIAVDMVDEGLITPEEAVARVDPAQLNQLLHPVFDPAARREIAADAKGLNASPGAASGHMVLTADDAVAWVQQGKQVILVRHETSPEDIHGMAVAAGVLTAAGGMTSHAAVVGRQMGKPSVVGCDALHVDLDHKTVTIGGKTAREGDYVSLDGTTGEVMLAEVPTVDSEVVRVLRGKLPPAKSPLFQAYDRLMGWADGLRRLKVRANEDRPDGARLAVAMGAQGIGLARTEHMFFEEERLPLMREMILAEDEKGRRAALRKLLPLQRKDFAGLFKAMDGLPVTIRTLDPPLHEFLPNRTDLKVRIEVLRATGRSTDDDGRTVEELEGLLRRVEALSEQNPMLGWRGCRLGNVVPEITEMQARAIFEAAAQVKKRGGAVLPEIMIPLVGHVEELRRQRAIVDRVAEEVFAKKGVTVPYKVGTMIEVPRGAITAAEVAEVAEFFSFGTNDLTQMTFGFSRDDAGRFLTPYVEDGILPRDPFVSLDVEGVGFLVRHAVEQGRGAHPGLKVGICGEHGGDPASVRFCHDAGLDYVSASPYRIPVARLAAAQAVLAEREAEEASSGRARKAARAVRGAAKGVTRQVKAAGAKAKAAGAKTKAAGTKTKAAGTRTKAAGTKAKAAGTRTKAAGTKTKAAGTRTKAAGAPSHNGRPDRAKGARKDEKSGSRPQRATPKAGR